MKKDELPMVTIGIPTYNRADGYLQEALQSALAQSYSNIEILISDNCSTDGTEDYVRRIGSQRIRYIRQKRPLTPNGNFNFCLNHAQGCYFLLLHDDDTIDHDFVETCMKAVGYSQDYALIRTGTRLINAESTAIRDIHNSVTDASPAGLCRAWFNNHISFYFCSSVFNTDLLKAAGGLYSKHNLLEDCNAIIDLSTRGKRVDISEVKASFREHANYLKYGLIVKRWAEDFLWLLDRISILIPEEALSLKSEGARFFASLSYKRAKVVASPLNRLIAHLVVFRKFGYRYPPPLLQAKTWVNMLNYHRP
jgi:glycosyltransferase involved in cell wall biosynthesis